MDGHFTEQLHSRPKCLGHPFPLLQNTFPVQFPRTTTTLSLAPRSMLTRTQKTAQWDVGPTRHGCCRLNWFRLSTQNQLVSTVTSGTLPSTPGAVTGLPLLQSIKMYGYFPLGWAECTTFPTFYKVFMNKCFAQGHKCHNWDLIPNSNADNTACQGTLATTRRICLESFVL